MAQPNTVQNRFAFGDDDGSESGHTLDTENNNRTAQGPDVTFLIRIQVEETNGKDDIWTFQLFAQKNGAGGYTAVSTARADGLRLANDTQARVDDSATTERLTAGAGTWLAGLFDDGQTQDGMGTALTLTGEYTDLEFAIEIDSGNAADTDYWDLQVYSTGSVALDTYTATPRVTADILEPIEITPAASVAGADSVDPTVRLGSLDLSPTLTAAGADSIDPSVQYSSVDVTPAVAAAGADSVNPTYQATTVLFPTTDDLRNGWTDEVAGTTNIYQSIDDITVNDSDYIQSSDNPSTEIYRTKLTSGSDPESSDDHVVAYRYKQNDGVGVVDLIVRLKQGVTVIASWTHNGIGIGIVNAEQTLSGAQADNITDYTDLYLEFEASEV